jgi:hypothetical protein
MGKLQVLVLTALLTTSSFGAAGSSGLHKEGADPGSVERFRETSWHSEGVARLSARARKLSRCGAGAIAEPTGMVTASPAKMSAGQNLRSTRSRKRSAADRDEGRCMCRWWELTRSCALPSKQLHPVNRRPKTSV